MDEAVEDAGEVDLDDGGGHAARHVPHLLQVLLLLILLPLLVLSDHPDLLLHQVSLDVL